MQSTGKVPKFTFIMKLSTKPQKELVLGNLTYYLGEKELYRWLATSGCRGYQFSGSTNLKEKGPLPSCKYAQIEKYEVVMKREFLPNVKGVEGSFYPILPYLVTCKGMSSQRGDFGVHFDANVPGSAGCIVIQKQGDWDIFRMLAKELDLKGIEKVRLEVSYL